MYIYCIHYLFDYGTMITAYIDIVDEKPTKNLCAAVCPRSKMTFVLDDGNIADEVFQLSVRRYIRWLNM